MSQVRMEWYGEKITEQIKKAANKALLESGEDLMRESRKIVPMLTGTLSSSSEVTQDEQSMVVNVSYDTPYAVRQHEDTRLRHRAGRSAKYLEKAFNTNRARYIKWIENAIHNVMK